MCPDPQILSIYLDGELPSPWKEKLENHLNECSACTEKLGSFRQLSGQLTCGQPVNAEQELITAAKDRIWQNIHSHQQSRRQFRPRFSGLRKTASNTGLLQRRLSISIPAAAAAAVIIMLTTAVFLRSGQDANSALAIQQIETFDDANFILAADEQIPGIIPTADINSVLQYLSSDRGDIIIIQLPENKNFYRTGEPEIIRAADYQRNEGSHNRPRRNR